MSGLFRKRTFLRRTDIARSYDVVIIGGGVNGLAIAYNLAARHGVRDIAVFERAYIESGRRQKHVGASRQLQHAGDGPALQGEPSGSGGRSRRSWTSTSSSARRGSSISSTAGTPSTPSATRRR